MDKLLDFEKKMDNFFEKKMDKKKPMPPPKQKRAGSKLQLCERPGQGGFLVEFWKNP